MPENGSEREREGEGEGERERVEGARKARYTGDENPRDKLHRPVMLIAHLKARLQNKLLEG